MEEKIIIEMENLKINLSNKAKKIICIILAVITFVLMSSISGAKWRTEEYAQEKEWAKVTYERSDDLQEKYSSFNKYLKALKDGTGEHYEAIETTWSGTEYKQYRNDIDWLYSAKNEEWAFTFIMSVVVPLVIMLAIIFINFLLSLPKLVLTDKRMYGKNVFGRQMDLPIDSISSVSTIKLFRGLRVATSSGVIRFYNLANVKTFHTEISNLLVERQNVKKVAERENIQKINISAADELKKYKELLDMGAITQEEFEIKKKEIL